MPPPDRPDAEPFETSAVAGETAGRGPDIVLAHGLTATRRYVVSGSRALPRAGYRLTTYDARGHGESSPADSYEYRDLVGDMAAVLDYIGAEQAVIGGASMGAHTAIACALSHAPRVKALLLITPAHEGRPSDDLDRWDRLADALERDGVDGFLAAYDPQVGDEWRETVLKVARQRLERHRHPKAVAHALREVPRSVAFELDALEQIEVPTLIVASHDEADPGHPRRIAEEYAARMPRARLVGEQPGESPLAWQGTRLSKAIAEFVEAL